MLHIALNQKLQISPQIFNDLRQAIITMRVLPGQRLSEKEIAESLGVSRQPVREAFIKLSEGGLVEILPQRGTFVVKISVKAVLDARFVREAIELAVVRKAIEQVGQDFFVLMTQLIQRQKDAAGSNDFDSFLYLDEEFHSSFARAIGREHAWHIVENEKLQMDRVRFLSLPGVSPMNRLVAQHEAILDAVQRRDSQAAEAALREHLSEVLAALPSIARSHPDYFEDLDCL